MHPTRARMLHAVSEKLNRANAQAHDVRTEIDSELSSGQFEVPSLGQVMVLGFRMAEASLLARAQEFLTPEAELGKLNEQREQEGQVI